MSNERITIRLPQELSDKLDLLHEQSGQARAKIIRDVLKRYLDRLY